MIHIYSFIHSFYHSKYKIKELKKQKYLCEKIPICTSLKVKNGVSMLENQPVYIFFYFHE